MGEDGKLRQRKQTEQEAMKHTYMLYTAVAFLMFATIFSILIAIIRTRLKTVFDVKPPLYDEFYEPFVATPLTQESTQYEDVKDRSQDYQLKLLSMSH